MDDKADRPATEPGRGGARPRIAPRARDAVWRGLKGGAKTSWFLVSIIVPVTLVVALLGWSGILERVAVVLRPLMALLGLSGDAALVFISSVFLNIYSAIAVAGSLSLDLRQATILAIMCLTAHNLIVETAVMRKSGSSAARMVLLRVAAALVLGWLYSLALPAFLSSRPFSAAFSQARPDFLGMLAAWAMSTGRLAVKIVAIVFGIMVAQRLLEEFKAMDFLSKLFAPIMKFFGLPDRSSFLWIVINVVGYSYGAGIVVEQIGSGKMKSQDGDLFNHHAGMCHSLLEDTALYLALGLPLFWLTLPRLLAAAVVVWAERARRALFRRSFRVGTQ
jgi:hypothetical protein